MIQINGSRDSPQEIFHISLNSFKNRFSSKHNTPQEIDLSFLFPIIFDEDERREN